MTVSHRKNKIQAKPDDGKLAVEPGIRYHCDACGADITLTVRVRCAGGCEDFDVCGSCFCAGVEVRQHRAWHDYRIVEQHAYPIFCEDWGADEELLLIDGCQIYGLGNWADIADHIGNRTKEEVERHYVQVFLEGRDGTEEGDSIAKQRLEEVVQAKKQEKSRQEQHAIKQDSAEPEAGEKEKGEDSKPKEIEPHWRRTTRRRLRSPTPPVGPNMDFRPTTTPEVFQQSKRRRVEQLREAQAAFQAPKQTKPLVSAPTSHSEIAGFMPGRLEFDLEYEQDAENLTKDMEFGRVYKYGGETIKSEQDALGGQKAVQGQARMPPSTRGAIGSRSGTGNNAKDKEGAEGSASKGVAEGDEDEQEKKDEEEKEEDDEDEDVKAKEAGKDDEDEEEEKEVAADASMADVTKEDATPAPAATEAAPATNDAGATTAAAGSSTAAAQASTSASAADQAAAGEEKPGDWDEDEADLELKLTILEMYNERLNRRARRKQFIFERNLVDYKRNLAAERKRPKEERDILNRVRHFSQLQTAQDFEDLLSGLCHEEALRRTAAQLQGWRRAGVTSLQDGLLYEKEREERRKKALAIAEGGIAAFQHTGMASGPRQRNEASKIARQRESSVASAHDAVEEKATAASSGRKERNADGTVKVGRKPPRPLDFTSDPNLSLLTEAEKVLCSTVRVRPAAYLTIKKQILVEYLRRQGKLSRRDCRTLFKMDVNKLGKIYDVIRDEGFLDAVTKYGIAGATVEPIAGTDQPPPAPSAGKSSTTNSSTAGGSSSQPNGHRDSLPNGTSGHSILANGAPQKNGSDNDPHRTSPWRPTATA